MDGCKSEWIQQMWEWTILLLLKGKTTKCSGFVIIGQTASFIFVGGLGGLYDFFTYKISAMVNAKLVVREEALHSRFLTTSSILFKKKTQSIFSTIDLASSVCNTSCYRTNESSEP